MRRARGNPVDSANTTRTHWDRAGQADQDSTYERIYSVVRRIPRGRVATYGQIAMLAGMPGHARQVGYALHALPDGTRVPWHRVINARGAVSTRSQPGVEVAQRMRLQSEGIVFDQVGRVRLARYRWRPRHADAKRRGRSRREPSA